MDDKTWMIRTDLEGVTGVAGVEGVAGMVGASASVVEVNGAPFGDFEVEGMEVCDDAAKDEDIAWGVGICASMALIGFDLPYFSSGQGCTSAHELKYPGDHRPCTLLISLFCSNRVRIFSFAIISFAVWKMTVPHPSTNVFASAMTSMISASSSPSAASKLFHRSSPIDPFCNKFCSAGLSSRIWRTRCTSVIARRTSADFSNALFAGGSILPSRVT